MEHFELKAIFTSLDLVNIKFQHIPCPEAQPGSIKRKSWFLFSSYANAQFERDLYRFFVVLQFVFIIEYRNYILKSGIQQVGDTTDIGLLLEAVANDIDLL